MADARGNPPRPYVRSYDAPTTPLPRPEIKPDLVFAPIEEPVARWRLPVRAVYVVFAFTGALAVMALVFTALNRRDTPSDVQIEQAARIRSTAVPSTPSVAAPPLRLPAVPAARSMRVHPGSGTAYAALVKDRKAGISYPRFGRPWRTAVPAPFQHLQKSGTAMIASGPLPGAAPGELRTGAEYRKLAARAARWTVLRYQPPGSKFTWTASQPVRYGRGWMVGYRVKYDVGGVSHTSDAIVALIDSGAAKPAMLFASVPDTHKDLRHDLNLLFWTVKAI